VAGPAMSEDPDEPDLRTRVVDYITEFGSATFGELTQVGPELTGGGHAIELCRNLVLWSDLTAEGSDAILGLLNEGAIVAERTDVFLYAACSRVLPLPIAKSIKDCNKPHWLPVMLRPAKKASGRSLKIKARAAA
jgi:hypothetical protein